MPTVRPTLIATAALALGLVVAACGGAATESVVGVGSGSPTHTEPTPTTNQGPTPAPDTADTPTADASSEDPAPDLSPTLPVTVVDELGTEVTIDSIDRIIPLDGTVAEVVFALGLGHNVVATDLSATFPPEADALPEIGYQRSLTAEAIAAFAPTVLLATDIAGPEETIEDLRRLGYPLVIVPNEATPAGPSQKIRAVAAALGVPERGDQLADRLDADIARHTVAATDDPPLVAALYLRGESTQLVLGRQSATHWLIEAAGGIDIADRLDIDDSVPLSPEALIAAAPDILLIPAAGLASVGGVDGVLNLGGISQTPAGRTGAIVAIDDQLLLGNGPRTGELLATLADAVAAVAR